MRRAEDPSLPVPPDAFAPLLTKGRAESPQAPQSLPRTSREACTFNPIYAPCKTACKDDPNFIDANGNKCRDWAKWSNPELAAQRQEAGTHIQTYPCRGGYKHGACPLSVPVPLHLV